MLENRGIKPCKHSRKCSRWRIAQRTSLLVKCWQCVFVPLCFWSPCWKLCPFFARQCCGLEFVSNTFITKLFFSGSVCETLLIYIINGCEVLKKLVAHSAKRSNKKHIGVLTLESVRPRNNIPVLTIATNNLTWITATMWLTSLVFLATWSWNKFGATNITFFTFVHNWV